MSWRCQAIAAAVVCLIVGCTAPAVDQPVDDAPMAPSNEASSVDEPEADPRSLSRAAWRSFKEGDSSLALAKLERAAAQHAAAGEVAAQLEALTGAAVVISETGGAKRAVRRLEGIIEHAERVELIEVAVRARVQLARASTLLGDFAAAHAALDGAQELAAAPVAAGDSVLAAPLLAALVDVGRSNTLLTEGDLNSAISVGQRAVERCENQGLASEAVRAKAVVAYAYHAQGEDDQALSLYSQLLAEGWRDNNQRLIQFVYCNVADIEWRRGQAKPAEEQLRATIADVESARSSSPATGDERAAYLSLRVDAYDRLIRLLADTYRGTEAFDVAERFHARSLLETLDAHREQPLADDHHQLARRQEQLLAELGASRLDIESTVGVERQALLQRIDATEAELTAVQLELRPARADSSTAAPPMTSASIQARLQPGEVLVEYWLSEQRTMAWLVTHQDLHFIELPLPREQLASWIGRYIEPLRSSRLAEDAALKGTEGEHIAVGRQLYDALIGALPASALADARRLIIVADDVLHSLPFEALIEACPGDSKPLADEVVHAQYRLCRFLGLDKAIAYSPSAGVFVQLRQRESKRTATRSMLALAPSFGNGEAPGTVQRSMSRAPLRHAADEVESVARWFQGSHIEVGAGATEALFKSQAGDHRLLHLATHGLIDDALPMVSGVLLAPGDGEDGLLQAHEVLDLHLVADLVTLSACRSGRGELSRGEGILGLSRSFLSAGSSAVLVSHWDVDDRSTAHLMAALYQELALGTGPAEALRIARAELFDQVGESRLAFRTRPVAYAHPRFWSAFVLVGAP